MEGSIQFNGHKKRGTKEVVEQTLQHINQGNSMDQ